LFAEVPLAQSVPAVVEAGWIIPVDPPGTVLADHAIVVTDGRIREVLPVNASRERYPVARRTVTKYRKMLKIPSSRQRKDWSLSAT